MNAKQIKAMQERLGVAADGFWGPVSIVACQVHLRGLMPTPAVWPKTDEGSLTAFFGAAGDEDRLTRIDVTGCGVRYEGHELKTLGCNRAVAESLGRIVRRLAVIHPEVLADYAGCFNNRKMRGGSRPSLHARGAAVDFMPGSNGNGTAWPVKATMPLEVMEVFASEGWLAAGAFWGRDAMHFQATR